MSQAFQVDRFGPVLAELLDIDRERALGEGSGDAQLTDALDGLTAAAAFAPADVADRDAADACLAGLWLLADQLDTSHSISQRLHTPEGSFWHGIMHRREGDFGNSKYWFRQVGGHPVYAVLGPAATAAGLPECDPWDAAQFVDLCQRARRDEELATKCRRLQRAEWESLFDFCYDRAVGH